jgi:hypothetical protein
MSRAIRCVILAAGAAFFLVSCAQTDVGSPCQLLTPNNTQVSTRPNTNIVQSGNGSCQQFVCASFAGGSPICTESCSTEGAACSNGLVCRAALLTPQLLDLLQQRTGGVATPEYQQLTVGMTDSLYCGPKP